ncbi:ABC transporter substrate-binding protein [Kribbia dieselivorans]|uniref:ABC transporter substrate-binding protein n=1 Tax=Kribbia dieselivorans TaxID=331526 RepID=UPI000837F44E|nr:ABC transporter substrate-binding protein [Kribbia dieselivorans]
MIRRSLLALAAATTAAGVLAACGGGASAGGGADDPAQTTIRYQASPGMADTVEVAAALGYLDPLKVEYVGDVQGGPEALRALATDQVDIGGAFNGAIAKAVATGVPIKGVVGYYGSTKDVRQSLTVLKDSPIKGPQDLIGRRIAVNTLGANSEAVIDTYLRRGGLSDEEIAKVTLVPLPSISMEGALRQGQVDVAQLGFTSREVAFDHGGVRSLVDDIDLVGEYTGGALALRNDFIAKNPEATKVLVAGLANSAAYIRDAPRAEVVKTLTDYRTKQGRPEAAKALASWGGNGVPVEGGVLKDSDFELWTDWLVAEGQIDQDAIKVGDIYTNEFNPYAKETS